MKRLAVLFVCFVSVVVCSGCLDDIEEATLDLPEDGIEAPKGLSVRVDDGVVILSWRPEQNVEKYLVYRAVEGVLEMRKVAEVPDTVYIDTDVRNGQVYYYAVSVLTTSGIEGERSDAVEAVPTIYAVMINAGELYTGSDVVALELTAPLTTALMKIGNDQSLADGVWEVYGQTRTWRLEAGDGDGLKEVYAVFRDDNGSISPTVSDGIILDTYARIVDVSFTPEPYEYSPGTTVHFILSVEDDEEGGEAWIQLTGFPDRIDLADDGRGGDTDTTDGIYEIDYRFPVHTRGLDLVVSGHFTDRTGNVAPVFESANTISFTDPPDPVYLVGVDDSTTDRITIRWEMSLDDYFASYRIYRDTLQGITELPGEQLPHSRLLVRELTSQTQTTYPDGGLVEGETYYYRVYVMNDLLEAAGSNELTAHTYDAIPNPVVLDPISSIGTDRLTLTWSINGNTDFKEYRIYRSTAPGVTEGSLLVATETDREKTFFDDTGLNTATTDYYYRVFVYDRSDKFSRSNEVSTAD
ncbi:MAG: fibronectin type III domain-containing protein [bacterium]|nr:MAG: fibronectin type III domain-containing protein [bacterium]